MLAHVLSCLLSWPVIPPLVPLVVLIHAHPKILSCCDGMMFVLGSSPSRYIGWIDIAQVVNDRYLTLFLECLRSSDEVLVRRSCSCILEVINKVRTCVLGLDSGTG